MVEETGSMMDDLEINNVSIKMQKAIYKKTGLPCWDIKIRVNNLNVCHRAGDTPEAAIDLINYELKSYFNLNDDED